ncbi:MAG: tRNA pseudouridine(38-40) synthase TruA [Holophagaceae bacterium]|uniref:tRNA pseudouridine synthase A n=1 Tax=Candidatus Geothrix skivensis TaxID=2954439 RepID=A0A9D7XL05_9BACT|nr:tRNA pseudouridine(38-40) synthase TruA [Candidatus Geothrix skivensis]
MVLKPPPLATYRLLLEFDGSRFQGWQKQGPKQSREGIRTVAGSIEHVLHEAGLRLVYLGGAGRTDSGVHALGQVAHLHLEAREAPRPGELRRILDSALPQDIAIRDVRSCPPRFHSRHDAQDRTYLYQISRRRSAFGKPWIWWVKRNLDLNRLSQAWLAFEGDQDVSAFADLDAEEDGRARIFQCEMAEAGALILLRVRATHFFRRQVRRMVGASVACALGEEEPRRVREDLGNPTEAANLFWGAKAAPASGLFLEAVRYPGDPEPGPVRPTLLIP